MQQALVIPPAHRTGRPEQLLLCFKPRRPDRAPSARRRDHSPAVADLTAIWVARRAGDKALERRLVADFMRRWGGDLATAYAARWRGAGEEQEDLQGAALLGLCEAVSRWRPGSGWSAYAFAWMRHTVSSLVHRAQLVRAPDALRADRRAVEKVRRQHPGLDDDEVAQRLGWPAERVTAAIPTMCPLLDNEG